MKLDVVLGLQWGDEGKGKIVDVLAGRYPAVARFQGGPNAGHSLHFDGHNFVVRSIPSGIFRDGSTNIIGVPLQQLGLKKNLLVCSINRKGKIITPTGQDAIQEGDIVVVVTTHKGIRDLSDIVRY